MNNLSIDNSMVSQPFSYNGKSTRQLTILWIVLSITLITGIILLVIFARRPTVSNSEIQLIVPCDILLSKLDNVTDVSKGYEQCYTYDGYLNEQTYYDNNNGWTVASIESRLAPSARQICQQICPQPILANDCLTTNNSYTNCINSIKPVNCTDPSIPVARRNSSYYYVIGYNRVGCYPPTYNYDYNQTNYTY